MIEPDMTSARSESAKNGLKTIDIVKALIYPCAIH